jgi:ribosomal-protein-alanine N-acetyltransferase
MEPIPSVFPVTIEGERVRLREFTLQDLDRAWEWARHPEFFRYIASGAPRSHEEERTWLNGVLEAATFRPRLYYRLGMELREGKLLIGDAAMGIESDRARGASIGYGVHPDWWGHGYATEAASLIVRFGFQTLRLHRIWGTHHPENVASGRVLEKLGMQYEGRLRDDRFIRGRWYDSVLCSILEEEWRSVADH